MTRLLSFLLLLAPLAIACNANRQNGQPCATQNDCSSGFCVPVGGALRCTDRCATREQCPGGANWTCSMTHGFTLTSDGGEEMSYDAGLAFLGNGGLCDCEAIAPDDITCDGVDDDCNGITDEGCGSAPIDSGGTDL